MIAKGDGINTCCCCDRRLHPMRRVWLELDHRINGYHDYGNVPEADSQGWFAFGPGCAAKLLREARAAAKARGLHLGRRRLGRVAQCSMSLSQKRFEDRAAALAALRAAYAAQGLDADAEVDGIATMTADQLRDELTYLSDHQG